MDEETIKGKGIKPLREILHQVTEVFPVGGSASRKSTLSESKDDKSLADTILYLQKIGVPSMLSCGAGADDKDPDVVVIQAGPPYRIGLPAKDYYSDGDVCNKYEATIAKVLENLHSNNNGKGQGVEVASKDLAHELVEFEKKLAAASPDAEDRDDVTVSAP